MRTSQTCVVLLLACAAMAFQGCSSDAETPKPAYSWGSFDAVESAGINKVYDASLKAAEELKLLVIQKDVDSMSGKITARDVADKKIIITLTATTDKMTKLSIRVGTLGDEGKSKLIYEQIKKKM